jgi:hypothetical protein
VAIEPVSVSLAENGEYYVIGGSVKTGSKTISTPLYLFSSTGLLWEKEDGGPLATISSDGRFIAGCNYQNIISYYNKSRGLLWQRDIKGIKQLAGKNHILVEGLKIINVNGRNYLIAVVPAADEKESSSLRWPVYLIIFNEQGAPTHVRKFRQDEDVSNINEQNMIGLDNKVAIIAGEKLLTFEIK